MESDRKPSLESETHAVTDDFVHVQDLTVSEMKSIEQEEKEEEEEEEGGGTNFNSENTSENLNSNLVERIATADVIASDDVSSANLETEGFETPPTAAAPLPMEEAEENLINPEEILKGVVLLDCESSAVGGSCQVYLVGTAHVSQESCREVEAVIRYLKPQVPTMKEMMHMWKKRKMNAFGVLYSWFLAKVASKLEVFPGSEFRVAYEEAMEYGGKVILGDRPVQITLRRTWGKMKLWHKVKFLYSILFQAMFLPSPEDLNKMLKEMDDVDMLTLVIQEMSKAFPTLMETLLYERDLYMSSTLLRVAREHTSVVAVVGKGHLQGIKKNWKQPVEIKELLEIPSRTSGVSAVRILTSLGVAVAGAAIVTGIYLGGKR
ncbi:hypothetical protein AQUCO_04700012v1 [Aquilegia coerulea]|uniref:TraB family protein n=1 Tax=Aquilegia coerulea TaxID=218851 RepID=A0A2G5CKS9_AQUCA|nr:hypothetical protein AQUCO_04700012v1 [Aquilegia coerulea]